MIRNLKLIIEYDGTNFFGSQIQDKTKRTVQGEIEKALRIIFKRKIRLIFAGRTDKGVHAQGQVANFRGNSKLKTKEILKALNANLPQDIAILDVQKALANFHAQHSAKAKTYRYTILNRLAPSSIHRNFCYFYPRPLNMSLMRSEAKSLTGKKDLKSFQASDHSNKERAENTTRTINKISIVKNNDFIYMDITADGFLYKMARNIIGTLLAVGCGRLPKGATQVILVKKDRTIAPKTAPAKGLTLLEVKY